MPNWKEFFDAEYQRSKQIFLAEESERKRKQAEQALSEQRRKVQEEAILQHYYRLGSEAIERLGIEDFLKELQPFWPRDNELVKTEFGYLLIDEFAQAYEYDYQLYYGSGWDQGEEHRKGTTSAKESISIRYRLHNFPQSNDLRLCVKNYRGRSIFLGTSLRDLLCPYCTGSWENYNQETEFLERKSCINVNNSEAVESCLKSLSSQYTRWGRRSAPKLTPPPKDPWYRKLGL